MPEVCLEWVCDVAHDQAAEKARPYGIPRVCTDLEQCTDVDIVLVAIPVGYRRKPLEYIFRRGWHAFCEKPFAVTEADHDWILNRAAAYGVEVGVGFMRRFYGGTLLATEILSRSPLGPPLEVWASEGNRMRGTGREKQWYQANRGAAGGGVLIETGSHLVDQAFTICSVQDYRVESCWLEYRRGLDYESKVMSSITLANGEKCKFGLALSKLNDLYNGIAIQFSNAQLRIGVSPGSPLYLCDRKGKQVARMDNSQGISTAAGVYQAFYSEWREFLAQCMTRQRSRVSADSTRLTTRFIESCYRLQPLKSESNSPTLNSSEYV
jgi:predicted dehydrogenase